MGKDSRGDRKNLQQNHSEARAQRVRHANLIGELKIQKAEQKKAVSGEAGGQDSLGLERQIV